MEDMLALRAKTEAGWVLAGALVLSGFLFFRYLMDMSSRPEGETLCIWNFSSQKISRYARNDRLKNFGSSEKFVGNFLRILASMSG
uniref:Uncharacterized protein n=1 Tax=Candidatus Kentrum sp. LFY TaxID=2126342 RepID=A0A450V2F9_9GAMM|nr:MAG: hypothetical protein BECKLFY1418A_GA0070994_109116 [Candidatus Kentron sp. LFY]